MAACQLISLRVVVIQPPTAARCRLGRAACLSMRRRVSSWAPTRRASKAANGLDADRTHRGPGVNFVLNALKSVAGQGALMGQILIRNLDDSVLDTLRRLRPKRAPSGPGADRARPGPLESRLSPGGSEPGTLVRDAPKLGPAPDHPACDSLCLGAALAARCVLVTADAALAGKAAAHTRYAGALRLLSAGAGSAFHLPPATDPGGREPNRSSAPPVPPARISPGEPQPR